MAGIKTTQLAINAEIVNKIAQKRKSGEPWTIDEVKELQKYSGDGGLKTGTRGMLYEYYTPQEIASRMWAMVYAAGFTGGNVMEPSVGIGRFLQYVDPSNCYVDAF